MTERRGTHAVSFPGIFSVVLFLAGHGFGKYNVHRYDQTGRPLVSFAVANQICVVVLLAAVICGVIAMRRGSKWWALAVAPALIFGIVYFLGDL